MIQALLLDLQSPGSQPSAKVEKSTKIRERIMENKKVFKCLAHLSQGNFQWKKTDFKRIGMPMISFLVRNSAWKLKRMLLFLEISIQEGALTNLNSKMILRFKWQLIKYDSGLFRKLSYTLKYFTSGLNSLLFATSTQFHRFACHEPGRSQSAIVL